MLSQIIVIATVVLAVANGHALYNYGKMYIVSKPSDVVRNALLDTNSFYEMIGKPENNPPPKEDIATMARFIVHNTDWTIIAFKSQQPKTKNLPIGTVLSFSDGPVEMSKGTPYMFVSDLEDVARDVKVDPHCALTMTLAQTEYCNQHDLDPQFPTCPQVTLNGKIEKVEAGSEEEKFATNALFSRHPSMKFWPKGHHFYMIKMVINSITILDDFGGPKVVDVDKYYKVKL